MDELDRIRGELLKAAAARTARQTLEQDVTEVVATLEGATAPLVAAVRDRLARHVKGAA